MNNIEEQDDFDTNMQNFMNVLESKGYVMESDHIYAYSMQFPDMKDKVINWLLSHGYNGNLRTIGAFDQVAVYCLFDEDRISYEKAYAKLLQEAAKQNNP